MSMSTTLTRPDLDSPSFAMPPPDPNDPLGNVPGKLGDILRNGGPLDSGIQRQMAGKHLLENADQYTDNPVQWEEAPKGKEFEFWDKQTGVADKPKDPRLKKDKAADTPRSLEEHFKAEDKPSSKQAEAGDKPYDRDKYYEKNQGHLDGGRATDWLNQKAYETKNREQAAEKGDGSTKSSFTETNVKRTGLSADTHYGNYTPTLKEGALSDIEIRRQAWHAGHEDVNRLNGGAGYSQTNAGVWTLDEKAKNAGTGSVGAGARGEIANVIDLPGSGELTLKANGMAGFEGSGGGKAKFKPHETTLAGGGEARVGAGGEFGGTYRPVTFEPKILGAPINLSPEVNWAGRVFNGAEAGAGFKAGWRLVPDPTTGKMSPEAGIEVKGAAFAGGKAEGEATAGLGGVGNVGGSVAGLYGIGAEGKAKVGLTKDESGKTKLKFELKGALALGLGLGAGIKGEINVDGLIRFASNLAKANRAFVNKVSHGAQTAIHAVKQGVNTAINSTKQAFNTAVDTVKHGVQTAVATTKEVAQKVVDKVKDTAVTVAEKAKEVATTVVDKAKEVADKVGDGIKEGAKKVGNFFKGLFK
ncbi:iron-regulated protein FrpC [Hydrogenophaga taeniospiralis CCUG 15921]|uniref:Iron-regulated protein FrpC n=2 Tax=Hydrogenophaga TaxID=47420 RepID=A0A9X4SDB9_9BURK|nr:iron-regulated protein FrpC [Hydrogenophaga taeniospiralis CCUG 15921]